MKKEYEEDTDRICSSERESSKRESREGEGGERESSEKEGGGRDRSGDDVGKDRSVGNSNGKDGCEKEGRGRVGGRKKSGTSRGGLTIVEITQIGIMAGIVYAASAFLQIPIPTVIGNTRLHMGNVICLLAGMLLGAFRGGLAAGVGSMLFDLTNPAYIASAPFTFLFKFAMAWVCGGIINHHTDNYIKDNCRAKRRRTSLRMRYLLGGAAGSITYIVCYLTKNFVEHRFVLGLPMEAVALMTAQKALVSSVNGVIACVAAVPLGLALRARKAGR